MSRFTDIALPQAARGLLVMPNTRSCQRPEQVGPDSFVAERDALLSSTWVKYRPPQVKARGAIWDEEAIVTMPGSSPASSIPNVPSSMSNGSSLGSPQHDVETEKNECQ